MKKILRPLLAFLPLVFLTGCFDTQEDFTLNPDGSGKVVITSLCAPFEMTTGDEKKTPEQKLLAKVKGIFDNTSGVAAWRDVAYHLEDDGRLAFKGTAYFNDLNKVDLNALAIMQFKLVKTNGTLVLAASMKDDDKKNKKTAEKLSEEELVAKIREARAGFQSSKAMLTGFLAGMKQSAHFHLPGSASAVSNFKSTADGGLEISFAGTNMIAAMEKLTASDQWWRGQLAAGGDVMKDGMQLDKDNDFNKILFGEKAPVSAVIAAGSAQFDYAAELAVARQEFSVLEKKLDTISDSKSDAEPEAVPMAKGGDFKSLKVTGIRWVFPKPEDEDDFQTRAFNESPGYAVAVLGELPGAVLAVSDGKLIAAVGSDGTDLLPEKEWDRKINFPRLSSDRTKVSFEVKMNSPATNVTGFKEIIGSLEYSVSHGTTNSDLGFTELKSGAGGTKFGAHIESIQPSSDGKGGQDIEVKLKMSVEDIISLAAVAADGTETNLKRNGSMSSNGECTVTFTAKTELPITARLVLKTHAEVTRFEIPFKLNNLNLLGQPAQ